jgi:tetratricopeptide (TPR) repeat protein
MKRRNRSKWSRSVRTGSPGKSISSGGGHSTPASSWWTNPWAVAICVLLFLAVFLVFGQALGYSFVNFDDNDYVYANPHLAQGLTGEGIVWAFTTTDCHNWHPLTWLSYFLDYQLFGFAPWGYHLTNLLLHAATAIALFLVLREMTGNLWPSAFVAAVFAIHPLRVESVAWVAERKDVLSGLFFMLTLAAYVGYVRRPFSLARYVLLLAVFALGLMAKSMLVTLPFVLLLLDYWPLKRMAMSWRLLVEKLPLLAMSAAACAVAPLAQGEAMVQLDIVPLSSRIANALVAYVAYVGQLFYPLGLAVFYSYRPNGIPSWQVAGAIVLLLAITAGAVVGWRRWPWLAVGWFWYLGMLVPVIGLVQVGSQSMADRYTYLPQIGLAIALAWGAGSALASWPHRAWAWGIVSALVLAASAGLAWRQTSYWCDNETLWKHTLECTPIAPIAHLNLGAALHDQGRLTEAIAEYQAALQFKPDYTDVLNNLGNALVESGRVDEAIVQYKKALQIRPDYAEAHNGLGVALGKTGHLDEAIAQCNQALEINPDFADAHSNLGIALAGRGRFDEAMAHFQKALELKPDHADARKNLDGARSQREALAKALAGQRESLRSRPHDVALLNEIAWMLATNPNASIRNGAEALELALRAAQLSNGREPAVLGTLAAAYAEAGRFAEAVQTAEKALELATQQNQQQMVQSIRIKIPLYRAGTPFREPAAAMAPTRP